MSLTYLLIFVSVVLSSYMVMPFVAQDLGNIMKRRRLTDRVITYLFYQLLRGLKVRVCLFTWILRNVIKPMWAQQIQEQTRLREFDSIEKIYWTVNRKVTCWNPEGQRQRADRQVGKFHETERAGWASTCRDNQHTCLHTRCSWLGNTSDTPTKRENKYLEAHLTQFWGNITQAESVKNLRLKSPRGFQRLTVEKNSGEAGISRRSYWSHRHARTYKQEQDKHWSRKCKKH